MDNILSKEKDIILSKEIINKYFQTVQTYEEGQLFLKGFNKESKTNKKFLSSLLFYKFRKETGVSDELHTFSRDLIIRVLRNEDIDSVKKEYLLSFDKYMKKDLDVIIDEYVSSYVCLGEIMLSIKSKSDEAAEHWEKEVEGLKNKLLHQVKVINGLDLFWVKIKELMDKKLQSISEAMDKAYWNKILEDINNKNYDVMIKQVDEIRELLLKVHDSVDIKEGLDTKYIQQLIDNDVFDGKALVSIVNFICGQVLRLGPPSEDKKISDLRLFLVNIISERFSPVEITICLELCTKLVMDLYNLVSFCKNQLKGDK